MKSNLLEQFLVIPTKSTITYMIHGKLSLDFIKATRVWMLNSDTGIKIISPQRAGRLIKHMRKFEDVTR